MTASVMSQDTLDFQYLSSSLSSLSRVRTSNTLIVRTYKQATQLYLTKRFKEALDTLHAIIAPQPQPHAVHQRDDSLSNGHDVPFSVAPIAHSSKSTKTKVWVFYLSLLHAIIELGPEEGKLSFGSTLWKQLSAKAKEGTVWEDIVRDGYFGNEGEVDAEVVVNLATLLLGHMQSQALNQQRLETYLSTSADPDANLGMIQDGIATPMSNATTSPKELTSRLRIIELYTLHVLPANDEWDYSQQFIELNDLLDDERKELFVNALLGLKDEKESMAQRQHELEELREREIEEQRFLQEEKQRDEERREEERRRHEAEAAAHAQAQAEKERARQQAIAASASSSSSNNGPRSKNPQQQHPPPSRNAKAPPSQKKPRLPPSPPASRDLYSRATFMFANLQDMVLQASRSVTGGNTFVLTQLLMFMVAFLLLIARRDLRLKLKRLLGDGWGKVRQTVGMGVKVSYI